MKRKNYFLLGMLLVVSAVLVSQNAWAGIKDRMKQRLPVIIDMKAKGIVGENGLGYLEFVSGQRANKAIVDQENKDRRTIYSHIAKQEGVSVDIVGKRRALQNMNRAKKGEFVKKEKGAWIRK